MRLTHHDGCGWVVGPDHRCTCGLWTVITKNRLTQLLDDEGYGAWIDTAQLVDTLRKHRELVLSALDADDPMSKSRAKRLAIQRRGVTPQDEPAEGTS